VKLSNNMVASHTETLQRLISQWMAF
jgi:hypothetical protein